MLHVSSLLDSWLSASTSYFQTWQNKLHSSHCGPSRFLSQDKFTPASGPLRLLDGFLSNSLMTHSVTSVMSLLIVTLSSTPTWSSYIRTPQSPLSSFICIYSSHQHLPYCISICLHAFSVSPAGNSCSVRVAAILPILFSPASRMEEYIVGDKGNVLTE